MNVLSGDFNGKGRRDEGIIFKPTFGYDCLYQDSNYNGVRIVNFTTSKNLVVNT